MLLRVCANPIAAGFNHYLFEAVAALITCTSVDKTRLDALEARIFPCFDIVLQQDVQEFHPYVFQIFALLLASHSIPVPDVYVNVRLLTFSKILLFLSLYFDLKNLFLIMKINIFWADLPIFRLNGRTSPDPSEPIATPLRFLRVLQICHVPPLRISYLRAVPGITCCLQPLHEHASPGLLQSSCLNPLQVDMDMTNAWGVQRWTQFVCYTEGFTISQPA